MTKVATAVKSDAAEIQIKPEIVKLADLIKKEIKFEGGVASVPKDLYTRTLPDGVTADTVKKLQEHDTQFAAAGLLALGEASIPVLKKDKKLDNTSLVVPTVGRDSFEFDFNRHKQVRNVGTGQQMDKYGTATVAFDKYGAGSRGEVKKVRDLLASQALAAFGS